MRQEGEDYAKDSIEKDESRLAELGRRTVEIFTVAHMFAERLEARNFCLRAFHNVLAAFRALHSALDCVAFVI
jgi:hypothetical protein